MVRATGQCIKPFEEPSLSPGTAAPDVDLPRGPLKLGFMGN